MTYQEFLKTYIFRSNKMTYQEFLKTYVKQSQKPKYYEDHYYSTIYGKDKAIPIELVIRRKASKNLSFIIRENI